MEHGISCCCISWVTFERLYGYLGYMRCILKSPYAKTMDSESRSTSLRMALFDGLHTAFYQSSTGTMCVFCTLTKILLFVCALWAYVTSNNIEQYFLWNMTVPIFAQTKAVLLLSGSQKRHFTLLVIRLHHKLTNYGVRGTVT